MKWAVPNNLFIQMLSLFLLLTDLAALLILVLGFVDWLNLWPFLPSCYPLIDHNSSKMDSSSRSFYKQR